MKNIYRTSGVNQVVNAIVDALTSASPSDRYLVGRDARYNLLLLSYLPAFVADFIIYASFASKISPPKGCPK